MRVQLMFLMLASVPSQALALPSAPVGNPPALEVSYNDLDLSTAEGERALNRRVRVAAIRVCAKITVIGRREALVRADCVRKSIARADQEIAVAIAAARNRANLAIR